MARTIVIVLPLTFTCGVTPYDVCIVFVGLLCRVLMASSKLNY